MAVKRIWRVYYDLPDHIVPTEVSKIFKLMSTRKALIRTINDAKKGKKTC